MDSPEAMDVFEELIEGLISIENMKAVVACRTFDAEADPRIHRWVKEAKAEKIEIGVLGDEDVRNTFAKFGADYDALDQKQRQLLRLPQNLYLWFVPPGSHAETPRFQSSCDLMERFWTYIRTKEETNTPGVDVYAVCEKIVSFMDQHARLTCPTNLLDHHWPRAVEALQSLSVLRKLEDGNVTFCHQSYFDYLLARRVYEKVLNGDGTVIDWLTQNDQPLLRREQLRLLLDLLRQTSPLEYTETLRLILDCTNLRFHVKHLALTFLGTQPDPIREETEFVLEYIEKEQWRSHLWSRVLHRHPMWFAELDEAGVIKKWLESSDPDLAQTAVWLMCNGHGSEGDRVAAHLERYEDASDPWPARISEVMLRSDIQDDSEAFFRLRMRLFQKGRWNCEYVHWKKFSERHPRRVLQLLNRHIRMALKASKGKRRGTFDGDLPSLRDSFRLVREGVERAAYKEPRVAWATAVRFWRPLQREVRLAKRHARVREDYSLLWNVKKKCGVLRGLCYATLVSAGRRLLDQDPATLGRLIQDAEVLSSRAFYHAILRIWMAAEPGNADRALMWIIQNPNSLCCGTRKATSRFEPAQRVIAHLAKHCSKETYAGLEQVILGFRDEKAWEDYKRHLPYRAWRCHGNEVGLAQFVLLSAMPNKRMSDAARRRLDEGRRKYGELPSKRHECSVGIIGVVVSPIPRGKECHVTDQQWLKTMTRDWGEKEGTPKPTGTGRQTEISVRMFAESLERAAAQDPQRFAALALRIPVEVPPEYLGHLMFGIEREAPPDGLSENAKAKWQPATNEQVKAVLRHVGYGNDISVAWGFCRLVRARPGLARSAEICNLLVRYAIEHPNPTADEFPVSSQMPDQEESVPDYSSSAWHCARGIAAEAIQSVLFEEPGLFEFLRNAIEHLVADCSPVVRVAAVDACLPLLKTDRDKAVGLLLRATDVKDDRTLTSDPVGRFLHFAIRSHAVELGSLVQRMVSSDLSEVAKAGAKWATSAWLHFGQLRETMEKCISGSVPQRAGIANVAATEISEESIERDVLKILEACLDDEDEEVRREACQACQSNLFEYPQGWELLERLPNLRAFPAAIERVVLLFLDSHQCPPKKYRAKLLRFFAESLKLAERTEATGNGLPDLYWLPGILLRIQRECDPNRDRELHEKCLDLWDKMLEQRIGEAEKQLNELDGGGFGVA